MKILVYLVVSICTFTFSEDVYVYQMDCEGEDQWVDGKKACNMHQNDIYVSMQSETDYEGYTVFKLKIQNISTDTVHVNPETMYAVRYFDGGKTDSVFIVNPVVKIEKAKKEIAESEDELDVIRKTQNTENTVVSIYRVLPSVQIGKKKSSDIGGTQVSNTIYQEKIKSLNNKLNQAQKDKLYWETNALLASTIYPLNYVDKNVLMSMNHCTRAVFHVQVGNNAFTFPIVYRKY